MPVLQSPHKLLAPVIFQSASVEPRISLQCGRFMHKPGFPQFRNVRSMAHQNSSKSLEEAIKFLEDYSACDVSDALLKLQKPNSGDVARAGHIADIKPYAPFSPFSGGHLSLQPKTIAPVSTLKLVDKTSRVPEVGADAAGAVPKGSHWVDLTDAGTVVVIEQPAGQSCAAIGGIMASRMKVRGVVGCVVAGRVRDVTELRRSGLPVWALGTSTVGTGAESKVYARNVAVDFRGVMISPGDIIMCDPAEGVVAIPKDLVNDVCDLMPKLVAADDKVKRDVEGGMTVAEAFKRHRN